MIRKSKMNPTLPAADLNKEMGKSGVDICTVKRLLEVGQTAYRPMKMQLLNTIMRTNIYSSLKSTNVILTYNGKELSVLRNLSLKG